MDNRVVNVVIAGLGGQGVLLASDILAEAALRAGYEVKKSEVHGMSQRGGFVASDVRFGRAEVFSPMVPEGEADFVVVLAEDQVDAARPFLRPGGQLLTPDWIDGKALSNRRTLNVAMLGALSVSLDFAEAAWREALTKRVPGKYRDVNDKAFAAGREAGLRRRD
ncbi:MAG: indolepyruvate oxidoreductase subunit beta [Candidatus Sumerlaeota bacterium]|nr:indolepyruvate oxidoreductase subunit beta [Candidatus Sumerlaeota bacterium]